MGTKRKKGTVVEEFYEVDCIKARHLVKGGAVEYLIHWKGYEDKDDTWEPLANLSGKPRALPLCLCQHRVGMREHARAEQREAARHSEPWGDG